MKPFHVIVLGAFLVFALAGVIVFATFSSGGGGGAVGTVTIWGALPEVVIQPLVNTLSAKDSSFGDIKYTFYSKNTLMPQLIEAIAKGTPPDLVLFSSENVVEHADKILTIPYSTLSRRDFQDTFVQAGETFLLDDGFKGYPFSIDPLVMYWNRSLFSTAGVARPPKYWDELSDITPKLSKKDERGGVTESAIALGTWSNITHAKAIFLSLLYQMGNPVIVKTDTGFKSVFATAIEKEVASAESVLRFYTEFADPVKPSYSWNRSRPNSQDAFLGGTLAIYFGRASELLSLRAANPNLNFDVAPIPTIRGSRGGTAAEVLALSIPRGSKNTQGALLVAQVFSAVDSQKVLSDITAMPSVRRDTLSASPANPFSQIFNNAALLGFSFLDPGPADSDSIFRRVVESVLSGQLRVSEAVRTGDAELSVLLH